MIKNTIMFHHSSGLIIPHRFHARFAGSLSSFRGNENFKLPAIQKESFIVGVSDHDRGYDEFDTIDLIGLKANKTEREKRRETFYKNSIARKNKDRIANNISLTHIKYMCHENTGYQKEINKIIQLNNKEQIDYEKIQTITLFLDNIAFDTSIGKETNKELQVENFTNGIKKVFYSIKGNIITIDPRPFSIASFEVMLYGYEAKDYPNKKVMSGVLYNITQKTL